MILEICIKFQTKLSLPAKGDSEVAADGVHQRGFPLLQTLTLNNKQTDLVYTLGLRRGPTK